jgi:hypothetical protein
MAVYVWDFSFNTGLAQAEVCVGRHGWCTLQVRVEGSGRQCCALLLVIAVFMSVDCSLAQPWYTQSADFYRTFGSAVWWVV